MSALRRRALIHALFFFSGFAALIYETVWTRQLVLVFGATLTSASTVLAGFMAGMALGSLLGARAARGGDPLRLYGKLELGIAAWAAAFPGIVKAIMGVIETTTLPIAPLRLILIFAAILPATTLMGLTFPVLSRLRSSADAGRDVGDLYAANLVGSCAGVITTAYVLLAFLGLARSHWLAVALNAAVGIAALSAPRWAADAPAPGAARGAAPKQAFACLFVAGLCGMAFEVVWLRMLMPSFNNSAYGFACVIFVFLLGLGGGSFAAARAPALGFEALGGLQLLSALYAYVGYRLYEVAELAQIRLGTMETSSIMPVILAPAIETLVVLLPLAVFQGMMLPIALRLAARGGDAGQAAGRLYFWNTCGAIAGALIAGFWLVPALNVQNALLATAAVSAAAGAALVAWALPGRRARYAAPALAAVAFAALAASLKGEHLPKKVLLDWLNRSGGEETFAYYADGAEASVAVVEGNRRLIINGVGVTGYSKATKMLAHLPLSLHPDPRRVLVICFGMGTTYRSALRHERAAVEVVDLVPAVFETFRYFYPDAERLLSHPRAARFVDDGRNHLLRARRGYDVIMVDPSPPLYAAGTVNLYSRDFFELARRRLNPGGILAVWVPEYPEPDFKMVMKSFVAAVPRAQMWLGTKDKGGLIMLGAEAPLPDDRRRIAAVFSGAGVQADLREYDAEFMRPDALWKLYLGSAQDYANYLAGSPEITDDFPRLEYPYFRSWRADYAKHPTALNGPR